MQDNILFKILRAVKRLTVYQSPAKPSPFVLEETKDDSSEPAKPDPKDALRNTLNQLDKLLHYARDLQQAMQQAQVALTDTNSSQTFQDLSQQLSALEKRKSEIEPIRVAFDAALRPRQEQVSVSLMENKNLLGELYSVPDNKDILFHHFEVPSTPPVKAMLVFLDGMVDKKVMTESILTPILALPKTQALCGDCLDRLAQTLEEHLPNNEVKPSKDFSAISQSINTGDTALFLEGSDTALVIGTKGYPTRSVSATRIEQSVRGSQLAFTESFRVNTALIRSILPSSELVTEIITIGQRAPMKCAVMYLKSLANPQLVKEVKRRISSICTDYITDIGMVEQFIEDHPNIPFPQMLSTERPDRVAAHLVEGRIAVVYDGSPFVHLLPVTFMTFFHSAEDFSLKFPASDFMRILRLLAAFLSVTLPSFYLAINYFHQEALPTELALAIAGAREAVPFPALLEIILMEISFELIREAGLRIPGMLGSTIGIVGAIILGQAAVAASIVSPIMVVVIAITGLSSFAIPDYRLSFALRTTRFAFLILSATLGLVGLAIGQLALTITLCTMKSFGMPYMVPIAPRVIPNLDVIARGPVYRQENRPDAVNSQDRHRQPHISRRWLLKDPIRQEEDDK